MIGIAAPVAVAGTNPMSTMASATEPTMKLGSATMAGSPPDCPAAGSPTGGTSRTGSFGLAFGLGVAIACLLRKQSRRVLIAPAAPVLVPIRALTLAMADPVGTQGTELLGRMSRRGTSQYCHFLNQSPAPESTGQSDAAELSQGFGASSVMDLRPSPPVIWAQVSGGGT